MDIDNYKACPCQSGKKIKFCCSKDILPDLNQILSLHHGKQFTAAVEKLDRSIAKNGPRACLVGLKTHVLIHLKEYDQAAELNAQFLKAYPRNPLGYQMDALLHAANHNPAEAIASLQNGLDACEANAIPVTMANAFRTVGMLLMSSGDVIAGRAHLIFASELREGEDEVVGQLVMQSFRSPDIPLPLKAEFALSVDDDCQEPWFDKYANAVNFSRVGRWRSARILMEQLNEKYPSTPEIIYAIAVWSMFLGDVERTDSALAEYSEQDGVDHDLAVQIRTIRMLLKDDPITKPLEFIRTTYQVDDVEKLTEAAVSSARLINGAILSQHFIDPQAPPPAAAYVLLDKDEVKSVEDAKEDSDYPQAVGEFLVFGKQTDRDARIEFYAVCDDNFDAYHKAVAEILPMLGDRSSDEVLDQVPMVDHMMTFKWNLPSDMTQEARSEFIGRQREYQYLEIFPNLPCLLFDGLSLEEAAKDPKHKLEAEALITATEQTLDSAVHEAFDFDRLREKIGLPVPQTVNLEEREFDALMPVDLQRVDYANIEDESLMKAYVIASSSGNFKVIRLAGPEVLKRPDMERFVRFEMIMVMLARLTSDTDEALELMQKARKHATAADRPIGGLLIDELELRLERNRPEGCQELLHVLQTNHMKDPQNQHRLATVLQRFGLLGPDGRMRRDPAEAMAPTAAGPAAAGADIWTPESEEPVAAEPEGKSKLWIPD